MTLNIERNEIKNIRFDALNIQHSVAGVIARITQTLVTYIRNQSYMYTHNISHDFSVANIYLHSEVINHVTQISCSIERWRRSPNLPSRLPQRYFDRDTPPQSSQLPARRKYTLAAISGVSLYIRRRK